MVTLYEQYYGIHDHWPATPRPNGDPQSLISVRAAEDNSRNGIHYAIERYQKSNILGSFGLNWVEFMALPNDIAEKMVAVAMSSAIEQSKRADEDQKAAESALRSEKTKVTIKKMN